MSALNITKENFENLVLSSGKPVLVDFFAPWCAPCKMLSPVIEEIANEHPELAVCKVNVDEQPELALKFGVTSIPTLAVFKNGELVSRLMGAKPKAQILKMTEAAGQ